MTYFCKIVSSFHEKLHFYTTERTFVLQITATIRHCINNCIVNILYINYTVLKFTKKDGQNKYQTQGSFNNIFKGLFALLGIARGKQIKFCRYIL